MKRIISKISRPALLATTTACALLLPLAQADAQDYGSDRYTTYGKVIRAEPIYREVVIRKPVQQCWTDEERYVIQEGQYHSNHYSNRSSRNTQHSRRSGDTLAGTVIGGVIGNQLGRNGSRSARAGATVAGAIIGSVIANEVTGGYRHSNKSYKRHRRHNRHHSHHRPSREIRYGVRPVERCETITKTHVEHRVEGYKVTYIHRGRKLTTRTRKDPGSRIKLTARVSPVQGQ